MQLTKVCKSLRPIEIEELKTDLRTFTAFNWKFSFRDSFWIFSKPFKNFTVDFPVTTLYFWLVQIKHVSILETIEAFIPLTNRVRGPYRKLRTEFLSPRFMAQARSARAINRRGKKRGSVTYSTDRENEVSKIFIISLVCVWRAQERFVFTRNGFKFLTPLESKTSQFEIVFKSLARFNT